MTRDHDHRSGELGRAIDGIRPIFQPLLWLDDLSLAGYESLARGPSGSPWQSPLELVAAARAAGRLTELTATMTRRSIEALTDVNWSPDLTLFGNLDPDAMIAPPDPATNQVLAGAAAAGTRIVAEITEHSLLARPRTLARAIDIVRSHGWGIAMDDVGVNDESLTLLPIVRPDIVKLDKSLLHKPFDAHAARISNTTRAHCDRTRALMVCEGVETDRHEARARVLGADLVQGYRYGHPAPLPAVTGRVGRPVALLAPPGTDEPTLAQHLTSFASAELPAAQIMTLVAELLTVVAGHTSAAMVIATAPAAALIATHLDALAAVVPYSVLVAVIAPGSSPNPAPGVHGVNASAQHQLGSPWSISAIGPTMALSILGDPPVDPAHPVRHRVIHDRSVVARILGQLLATVVRT